MENLDIHDGEDRKFVLDMHEKAQARLEILKDASLRVAEAPAADDIKGAASGLLLTILGDMARDEAVRTDEMKNRKDDEEGGAYDRDLAGEPTESPILEMSLRGLPREQLVKSRKLAAAAGDKPVMMSCDRLISAMDEDTKAERDVDELFKNERKAYA